MDELYKLDLMLFAIGAQVKIVPGTPRGSAWHAIAQVGDGKTVTGSGNRPWVAVEEAMKAAGKYRDNLQR